MSTNLIPSLIIKLYKVIEKKLDESLVITLILDIWTNKVGADYIAVAVSTTNASASCIIRWHHEVFTV